MVSGKTALYSAVLSFEGPCYLLSPKVTCGTLIVNDASFPIALWAVLGCRGGRSLHSLDPV